MTNLPAFGGRWVLEYRLTGSRLCSEVPGPLCALPGFDCLPPRICLGSIAGTLRPAVPGRLGGGGGPETEHLT